MSKNPYENIDDAIEKLADKAKHNGEKPKEEKVRINLMINKSSYEFLVSEVSTIQKKQGKPYPLSTYIRDVLEQHIKAEQHKYINT